MSPNTAFMWRHKILDALTRADEKADPVELGGIVEADETFFALSLKGPKDKSFRYPNGRRPRRRGGECATRGLSKDKVCVPCAIERDRKVSVAKIGGLGKIAGDGIETVLGRRVKAKSILCTDREKSYVAFSLSHGLEHIALPKSRAKSGIFHIQHINGFHSRLKAFLDPFKGVSTKHLNNYLEWNGVMCENGARKDESLTSDRAWRRGLKSVGHTLYREVCSRPAVPLSRTKEAGNGQRQPAAGQKRKERRAPYAIHLSFISPFQ
jgi:transposase-like protein